MSHLTDEDWDALVAAPHDTSRFQHLNDCSSCRSIAESLAADAVPGRILVRASRQQRVERRATFPWRAASTLLAFGCMVLGFTAFYLQQELNARHGREVKLEAKLVAALSRNEGRPNLPERPERPERPDPGPTRVVASIMTTDDVLDKVADLRAKEKGEINLYAADDKTLQACNPRIRAKFKQIGKLEAVDAVVPTLNRHEDQNRQFILH
jgi:hypothetical protein